MKEYWALKIGQEYVGQFNGKWNNTQTIDINKAKLFDSLEYAGKYAKMKYSNSEIKPEIVKVSRTTTEIKG